jgi:uncharacterized protein
MAIEDAYQLILRLYKAFEKADIQTVLESLADDVEWIEPGGEQLPWSGVWRGPDEVAECFRRLNKHLVNQVVSPREILAKDDRVVGLGTSVAEVVATGRKVEQDWVMVWSVSNGRVTHYQYFDDTSKWLEALQPRKETLTSLDA